MTYYHSSHRFSSRWLLIAIIFAFLFVFFIWLGGGKKLILTKPDLLTVDWPDSLEFCGEEVPLDDFYVREAWEREFLITLAQDYQNILYLKRAPKYFPAIEAELRSRDLPEDLKYLAVAESALREKIRSSAGAEGIWQFIPETARRYGLQVDDSIDERRHFEKATNSALNYLSFLNNKFDSWTLAAASYNAGENGIARRITEQEVESYYDLYLNDETSRYLFRILAIKEIMQDPEKYGYELDESDYFQYPNFKIVNLNKSINDLANWAVRNNTTLRKIKELNPWIVGNNLPEGNWNLKVAE